MARFTDDKERQSICIGLGRIYIVKGTNKNGKTYYMLKVMNEDNSRIIHSEFIEYERLNYYLYLVKICDYDKYNEI